MSYIKPEENNISAIENENEQEAINKDTEFLLIFFNTIRDIQFSTNLKDSILKNEDLKNSTEILKLQLQNFSKDHISFLEAYHNNLFDYEKALQQYKEIIDNLEIEIIRKKKCL